MLHGGKCKIVSAPWFHQGLHAVPTLHTTVVLRLPLRQMCKHAIFQRMWDGVWNGGHCKQLEKLQNADKRIKTRNAKSTNMQVSHSPCSFHQWFEEHWLVLFILTPRIQKDRMFLTSSYWHIRPEPDTLTKPSWQEFWNFVERYLSTYKLKVLLIIRRVGGLKLCPSSTVISGVEFWYQE